ncbi:MAG: 50S ribosomal protein L6 [Proteobacteria bacterium]|nr:50S ribosomal protein L6 [Pseudomonadota bacterium]
MSRIGLKPITLPKGVQVSVDNKNITVKGPKGELVRVIHDSMKVNVTDQELSVVPLKDNVAAFHGLTRSLLNNMVIGVSEGFTKSLQLIGVGYRAQVKGRELHLNLGFSHNVIYPLPDGIDCKVEKNTLCTIYGSNKELVGQVAATIRNYRKPEPYHGKGVRYTDERIVLKAGKSAKK